MFTIRLEYFFLALVATVSIIYFFKKHKEDEIEFQDSNDDDF